METTSPQDIIHLKIRYAGNKLLNIGINPTAIPTNMKPRTIGYLLPNVSKIGPKKKSSTITTHSAIVSILPNLVAKVL